MIKIKVDNDTLFKGEVGDWEAKPPDVFRNAIDPRATPKPWMKAVLIAMADAINSTDSTSITVKTRLKGVKQGWSMEVVHAND